MTIEKAAEHKKSENREIRDLMKPPHHPILGSSGQNSF